MHLYAICELDSVGFNYLEFFLNVVITLTSNVVLIQDQAQAASFLSTVVSLKQYFFETGCFRGIVIEIGF